MTYVGTQFFESGRDLWEGGLRRWSFLFNRKKTKELPIFKIQLDH